VQLQRTFCALTVASSLSSIHQNADIAAAIAMQENEGRRIRLIDAGTEAAGSRLLALAAGQLDSPG
jgi:hypothetical protein